MKRELENLCDKYPSLYRSRRDKKDEVIPWQFSCGDGWYVLIDTISELMTQHNSEICAVQVKQKLGCLRFYHHPVDRYSVAIEEGAGFISSLVCEICGKPGRRNYDAGWITTLCEKHNSNLGYKNIKDDDPYKDSIYGLGSFWSSMMHKLLELCVRNTEENEMPPVLIDAGNINGKLIITAIGGDEFTKGVVDLFTAYANRVDERTGLPIDLENEKLGSE